ncbi:hypothetical protein ACFLV5_04125 [Chloroflexota bacterium]
MGKKTTTTGSHASRIVWDNLEEWVRKKVQEFIQSLLEEKVTELLARKKSERRKALDRRDIFQNVKTLRITSRTGLTVNFVTRITKSYVEIVKKRGWNIAITPTSSDAFAENANRALEQWVRTQREMGVT